MHRIFDLFGLLSFGSLTLFAADVVPELPSGLGSLANLSAVAVLAWWAWSQQRELRDLRQSHTAVVDKLCDRWDAWEKIRHEDSEKLDVTLRDITANCAKRQQTT
jgi:L-lactate permease